MRVYGYKFPRKIAFSFYLELRKVSFLPPFVGQVPPTPNLSFPCHPLGGSSDLTSLLVLTLSFVPVPISALENGTSNLPGIGRYPRAAIGSLPTYFSGLFLYYYFQP